MIPKVIHYCWFGGKSKSQLVQKCIRSWQKYAPDFEVREWNENNFSFQNSKYAMEAYKAKKWAFVSDYTRFAILNQFGGIYLDTDVELLKPLNENLLVSDFVGFENASSVNSGLIMGAHAQSDICIKMLESYKNDSFILENGQLNIYTVCQRMTKLLVEEGLKLNDKTQIVNGLKIYDSRYFNPLGMDGKGEITSVAYSVHHYNASWYTPKEKMIKVLGPKATKAIVKVLHFVRRR